MRWEAGQVGSAFAFDGATGAVGISDDPAFALTGDISIEAWVRVADYPEYLAQVLFRGDNQGGRDPYYLAVNPDGDLVWHLENEASGSTIGAPVPLDVWVHVVASFDVGSGAQRIWIDGDLTQEGAGVPAFGPLDPTLSAGLGLGNLQSGGGGTQPYSGLLDELVVYDRALDAAEIADHHAWGQTGHAFCE